MNTLEIQARLMLAGFKNVKVWAEANGFDADTVRATLNRWCKNEPRQVKRRLRYGVSRDLPMGKLAREILAKLSDTINEEILPGIWRYLPRPVDEAALQEAVEALGGGVERISEAQIEQLQTLALRIEQESFLQGRPKDIRGIWQVVKSRAGVRSYRHIPADTFEDIRQYLQTWWQKLKEKPSHL